MKSVEVSCKVNLLMKRLSKGIIPIMNDKIKGWAVHMEAMLLRMQTSFLLLKNVKKCNLEYSL